MEYYQSYMAYGVWKSPPPSKKAFMGGGGDSHWHRKSNTIIGKIIIEKHIKEEFSLPVWAFLADTFPSDPKRQTHPPPTFPIRPILQGLAVPMYDT